MATSHHQPDSISHANSSWLFTRYPPLESNVGNFQKIPQSRLEVDTGKIIFNKKWRIFEPRLMTRGYIPMFAKALVFSFDSRRPGTSEHRHLNGICVSIHEASHEKDHAVCHQKIICMSMIIWNVHGFSRHLLMSIRFSWDFPKFDDQKSLIFLGNEAIVSWNVWRWIRWFTGWGPPFR